MEPVVVSASKLGAIWPKRKLEQVSDEIRRRKKSRSLTSDVHWQKPCLRTYARTICKGSRKGSRIFNSSSGRIDAISIMVIEEEGGSGFRTEEKEEEEEGEGEGRGRGRKREEKKEGEEDVEANDNWQLALMTHSFESFSSPFLRTQLIFSSGMALSFVPLDFLESPQKEAELRAQRPRH